MHAARVATEDDLARLARLLHDAIEQTPGTRAGHLYGFPPRSESPEQRLLQAMRSEAAVVITGLLDGYAAGVALAHIDDNMPGGRLAIIEELYVEPEAREVGVGEALLDACTDWAKTMGCSGIEVDALPGARSAKNLAERSGFTARRITLFRPL